MIDIRKLAFIGGGNIAAALIGGLIGRGLQPARIIVADPNREQLPRLGHQYGAGVVVLAVKPQLMRAVASELAPHLAEPAPLILSVAAGIPHTALAAWLGRGASIVRAMPSRPAFCGIGATGLYAPPMVGAADRALAESILAAVGITVWVERESHMDVVTAVSGSGPSYFFLFMEALEAAARELGLAPDVAHRLTTQTALGAAQMASESADSLAVLREQVT